MADPKNPHSKLLVACSHCQTQYDVTGKHAGETFHCRCGGTVLIKQPTMHDARLVRCASCGASRNDGENCSFCGARFSAVEKGWGGMCPGCFCRLPSDANYCVECGLRINPQSLTDAKTKLQCPRCKVPMGTHKVGGVELTECGSCAGVWLGVELFDQICKSKETQSVATVGLKKARGGRRTVFELSADEQVKYVPCPKCSNLMNRRNFARVSGVIIDTCRDCGVWLDNQELGRIIQFINSGGLEKTRDIEARERADAERAAKSKPAVASLPLGSESKSTFSLSLGRRTSTKGDLLAVAIEGVVTGVLRSLFK
ncbi:MAG TPA: zf-TFIIB domain-containing protein [Planctomycetota bacterium]|nr:zf-TFIIB domain-containing protein [Planctomycetota bacterium]